MLAEFRNMCYLWHAENKAGSGIIHCLTAARPSNGTMLIEKKLWINVDNFRNALNVVKQISKDCTVV